MPKIKILKQKNHMKTNKIITLFLALGCLIINFGFTPPVPTEMKFICDKAWRPINQGIGARDNIIVYSSNHKYLFNPEVDKNPGVWTFEKDKKIHIRFNNSNQEWILQIMSSTNDTLVLRTQNNELIEYVSANDTEAIMQLSKIQ